MANPKHLKLLQRGVGGWNAWRTKERSTWPPSTLPDLSGANLRGADLTNADSRG